MVHTITLKNVISVAPEAELDAVLKDTLVLQAGATMKLHAKIKGHPVPKVTWAKMNTNIKNRHGIVIKVTDTDTMVYVEKVHRYDAGKYILNLDSVSGMKMYTVVVKVLGKFMDICKMFSIGLLRKLHLKNSLLRLRLLFNRYPRPTT